MTSLAHTEHLRSALDELSEALAANIDRSAEIRRRIDEFRDELAAGVDVHTLLTREDSPRTVELLTANHVALETAGAKFRAAVAQGLRHEGLTVEAIARIFGVTRQRISALLRQRSATG